MIRQDLYLLMTRGVAWSSGHHRSLSLQGSAVQIPAMPFISFTTKKATRSEEQCEAEAKNVNAKWKRRTCEAKYDDWQRWDLSQE